MVLATVIGLVAGFGAVARPLAVHAATGDISTVAGTGVGGYAGDGGPATSAQLNLPIGVAVDTAGNKYVADLGNAVVRKIDTSGVITTVAGTGAPGFSGDGGPATSAQLTQPYGLALDSAGNLYIADQGSNANRIRKVDTSGVITTFAGDGSLSPSPDGTPAASAGIGQPQYLTITSAGFFFADDVNNKVWKIDSGGILSTYASGIPGAKGLAADSAGDLYVTAYNANLVDKIDTTGNVTVIAGTGAAGYAGDGGPATTAQMNGPYDVTAFAGAVYFSDLGNNVIRKVDPSGTITTVAGNGTGGYSGDGGPASSAQLQNPAGLAFAANGDLLVADFSNNRLRNVTGQGADLLTLADSAPTNVASAQTFAYTLTVTNPGSVGAATGVTLMDSLPAGVAFVSATASQGTCSASGGVVNCSIGTLTAGTTAMITISVTAPSASTAIVNNASVTANEVDPAPGDNAASTATFVDSADIALSATASPSTAVAAQPMTYTLMVSNAGPFQATGVNLSDTLPTGVTLGAIVTSQGTCASASGAVTCSLGSLGAGNSATITINVVPAPNVSPLVNAATVGATQLDPNQANNSATLHTRVIPFPGFGDISTVAGTGVGGYAGDGGPAASAQLNLPIGVAVDTAGNEYVADLGNAVVRKIDTSGVITTVAGTGAPGFSGDGGPATSAQLTQPYGLALDSAGNLYISDQGRGVNRIRKVDTSGVITTFAGNGSLSPSPDGTPAASAGIGQPQYLAITSAGFFFADDVNNKVWKIDSGGILSTYASGISGALGLAADSAGNLYVTANSANLVDKIDTTGKVTVIAGTGAAGYAGDGGPATSAQMNEPYDVTTLAGAVYFTDLSNNVIREVDSSGTITTVAGNGTGGHSGDGGPATSAQLQNPAGLAFAANSDLLVADFANNAVRAVSKLGADLLSVSGPSPLFVGSGAQFNYTFKVKNPGSVGPATGVTLSDPLPAGVTFVNGSATQGACTATSGTVTCALGQLAAGAFDTVTISVRAASAAVDATNIATVSANEADPAPGDNSASVLTHVGEVDLSVSQTGPSPVSVIVNQPFTLSMAIASRGPATSVTLIDPLSPRLKFLSATASQGTCSSSSGTVTCALGAIADGGSATATVRVTPIVAGTGKITNTATVSAAQPDIDPTNNSASAFVYVNGVGCGEVISASTTLSADIGPCYGNGVIIGADGITFNLNGHSIIGDNLRLDDMAGIRLPVRNFVTIENGSVTGFGAGIFFNSGGGNTVTNMKIHDNIGAIPFCPFVGGCAAPDVVFPSFGDGILIQHSAANKILSSAIIHNGIYDGVGIFGLDSNFNLVQGNTISKNTNADGGASDGEGVALSGFLEYGDPRRTNSIYGNNIVGNTIDDNTASGISSVANVNGQYLNNDVERNGVNSGSYPQNGIGLQPEAASTENLNDVVENNKVIGNGNDGIQATQGASGSLIKSNIVEGNDANGTGHGHDLKDYEGDCSHNVWTGNTYSASGGVNPSCLATTNTLASASTPAASPAAQAATNSKPGPPDASRLPRGRVDPAVQPQGSAKVASPAAAPANPPSTAPPCGSVITASVTLTADIGPCSGPGLIAGADNVTIDLGGHKIVGQGVGDGVSPGVLVEGHQGVTVKHGSISNFDAGVAVYMGAYNTVSNLNIHDNIGPTSQPLGTTTPIWIRVSPGGPYPTPVMGEGIAVFHSFATQVLNNTVTHNGVYAGIGIYGADANANVVRGNTVTNTVGDAGSGGIGIAVSAAFEPDDLRAYLPIEANSVLANTVTGNQGAGILSLGNTNGVIKSNVVKNNGVGTSGSPRDGIQINFNGAGGASPGTITTVQGNTVSGNGDNGIAVYSGGNTIQGNTAAGDNLNKDGSFDLFDSHPTCDHNTWQGNTSGSAGVSPSCA